MTLTKIRASSATRKQPKSGSKVKKKQARNPQPGIRQVGGRIYDSTNGTTCHQCRQKTVEIKAKCKKCTLYYCVRCLNNRYNEDVNAVNALQSWKCPRCRNLCNCSNCMKKSGKQATGMLVHVAKTAGFGSVSELLQRKSDGQVLEMTLKAAAKSGKRKSSIPGHSNDPKRRKIHAESADLVDNVELAPRKVAMPLGAPLAIHKSAAVVTATAAATPITINSPVSTATKQLKSRAKAAAMPASTPGGSAKRQRGPPWLDRLSEPHPLPDGVDSGELASILEFVSTFGCSSVLGLRPPISLAALAAEIIQPSAVRRTAQLCPVPEDSIAAALHVKLLEVVRGAWGLEDSPLSLSVWQDLMREYYAAEVIIPEHAAVLRYELGPPALAGDLLNFLPDDQEVEDREERGKRLSRQRSKATVQEKDSNAQGGSKESGCADESELIATDVQDSSKTDCSSEEEDEEEEDDEHEALYQIEPTLLRNEQQVSHSSCGLGTC